jgi:hypothetical protein
LRTFARAFSLTCGRLFKTRDTVPIETLAISAISRTLGMVESQEDRTAGTA